MDWTESQDLIEIYLSEVDERSTALSEGAERIVHGELTADELEDLVRHAHTLKGSSHMIGRPKVGAAAAALERAWKLVRDQPARRGAILAGDMGQVAGMLPEAARNPTVEEGLTEAVARVIARVEALAETEDHEAETENYEEDSHREIDLDELEHIASHANLGGLLGSITSQLSGSVTRVDTADLYRLINRAVEISLDAEALADLTHVAIEGASPERIMEAWRGQLERLSADIDELAMGAVSLANVTFGEAVETFGQFVRFLGRRLKKEVTFQASGTDVVVDRQIVDLVREPLRLLVVNAIDHGIETPQERRSAGKKAEGEVRLAAAVTDERLVITVSDDGRGIDWEAVKGAARERGLGAEPSELRGFLFRPGFTTVEAPNDFSGTGEGLAMVADAAERVGGSVSIQSQPGHGTTIKLDLPVSLVLQNVIIVASGDQFFGLSEPAVVGAVSVETSSVEFGDQGRELVYEGEGVPVVSFSDALSVPSGEPENEALLLSTRSGLVAVAVSEIIDRRRVAVKSLGPILEGSDHLTGAAFLGGGQVLVVVDHNFLGEQARRPEGDRGRRMRVLVVDDSAGVRQLISATLRGHGYDVTLAASARQAVLEMETNSFDALVVDYSMPRSNGVELVRALREAGVRIPMVMVSGVADEEDKRAAWEAGVDAYLDKYDLRRGALTSALSRLLEERSRAQAR